MQKINTSVTYLIVIALIAVGADHLNWIVIEGGGNPYVRFGSRFIMLISCMWIFRWMTRRIVESIALNRTEQEHIMKIDLYTYLFFLFPLLGSVGIQIKRPIVAIFLFLFLLSKAFLLYQAQGKRDQRNTSNLSERLAFLFLISGIAAIIYQIVWQRVLFAALGINIESVTIIVSVFMFGLGIGSLIGGGLSKRYPSKLPQLFLFCEVMIGLFGVISLFLIDAICDAYTSESHVSLFLVVYGLLSIPTLFMGATLPILVAYLHQFYKEVGRSVGTLYFFNTLGSAIACFITVDILFTFFGLQTATFIAAAVNLLVGVAVFVYLQQVKQQEQVT